MTSICEIFATLIHYIHPYKKKNRIVFIIPKHGLWGGNLRAFFDYCYNINEYSLAIINLGKADAEILQNKYPKAKVFGHKSYHALWFSLGASCFVITHGMTLFKGLWKGLDRHKLILNLWHGTMIKAIGNLQKSNAGLLSKQKKVYQKSLRYDLVCSSSDTDKAIMSSILLVLGDKMLVSGLPKNDILLCPEPELPNDYKNFLTNLKKRLSGRRLFLYAPTFRDKGEQPFFSDNEANALEELAKQHNLVIGFRYHGLDSQNEFRARYARQIKNHTFLDLGADLCGEANVILRITDVLIADYSSVLIDFILLNRPIIKYAYDLSDYIDMRGLLYDYNNVIPGELAPSFDSLCSKIKEKYPTIVDYKNKYLFHKYFDCKSSSRIYNKLRELIQT